ncbi:hypothetical protein CRUP_011233 [Coryphaenoides rupestris]|nr:hypothetical protein CRUP_011233 [Coryphaenoides rupestris]
MENSTTVRPYHWDWEYYYDYVDTVIVDQSQLKYNKSIFSSARADFWKLRLRRRCPYRWPRRLIGRAWTRPTCCRKRSGDCAPLHSSYAYSDSNAEPASGIQTDITVLLTASGPRGGGVREAGGQHPRVELPGDGGPLLGLQEMQHDASEQLHSLRSGGGRSGSLTLQGPVVQPQQVPLGPGVTQDLVHRGRVRGDRPLEPAEELQGGRVLVRVLLQQGPQGPPGEQEGRVARQAAITTGTDCCVLAVA